MGVSVPDLTRTIKAQRPSFVVVKPTREMSGSLIDLAIWASSGGGDGDSGRPGICFVLSLIGFTSIQQNFPNPGPRSSISILKSAVPEIAGILHPDRRLLLFDRRPRIRVR